MSHWLLITGVKTNREKERSPIEEAIAQWLMLRLTTIPALTMTSLEQLKVFRQSVYAVLGNGRDALFDLMDAVLVSRSVSSFAELALSPVFRRQWSSVYAAIADSQPPQRELLKEYVQHLPQQEVMVLAGDHTAWSRP